MQEELIGYTDKTICTINPAVLRDGRNISDAPLPKINPENPHICNKQYSNAEDHQQDLSNLIATVCTLRMVYKIVALVTLNHYNQKLLLSEMKKTMSLLYSLLGMMD